jgi:hypothetical protein
MCIITGLQIFRVATFDINLWHWTEIHANQYWSVNVISRRSARGAKFKKKRGKAVPLQAWSGPEGSRKLRFLDYMTTAQNGGKVVNLTHRPHLPPGNAPGTQFC